MTDTLKKIVAVLLTAVICLPLCSCKSADGEEGILSYQDSALKVTGTFTENGVECRVTLTMSAPGEDGIREQIELEFDPSEHTGGTAYGFRKNGSDYIAYCQDTEIPLSEKAALRALRASELFCLKPEYIVSVEAAENGGGTVAVLKNSDTGEKWTVVTGEDGLPTEISSSPEGGDMSFIIDSLEKQ